MSDVSFLTSKRDLLSEAADRNQDVVLLVRDLAKEHGANPLFHDKLASLLESASDTHYNEGEDLLIDAQYDVLRDTLAKLAPQHPQLKKVGAPTKSKIWPKHQHDIIMGSLDKVNSIEELEEFYKKQTRGKDVCATDKLDGNSIDIQYEDGVLIQGVSRGNGEIGDNITPNVRRMQVPQTIPIKNKVRVRGEFLLHVQDWIDNFLKATPEGKKPPKNPRNSAAGTARRSDGEKCEHLRVYAYRLWIEGDHPYGSLQLKSEQLKVLAKLGFETPNWAVSNDFAELAGLIKQYEDSLRATLPYEIDGIVIEDNDNDWLEEQGYSDNRPRAARAYKFEAQFAETLVQEIVWQTGRSGDLTPVGLLRPTDIGGVTVSRVSLCNPAELYRLSSTAQFGVGSTAKLERRNDVIPKITQNYTEGQSIPVPNCPDCGFVPTFRVSHKKSKDGQEEAQLAIYPGKGVVQHVQDVLDLRGLDASAIKGASYTCENFNCPGRSLSRIMHFLSTLDVKGFGDKTVEKLMDAGKLKDPADLYSLYPGDIADLEGGSEKVAIKLLRELRDKSDGVPLPKFVKALGFELFGESYTEIVMETFPSLAAMRQLTEADVAGIPRIGPAIAQAMVHGFKHNKELIDKLLPHVRIAERKLTGPLSGKVFCFTGLRDKGAEQDIEDQGGKVAEKYTKAVTHLICKDPKGKSEKLERARKEGAEILSLDALKSLLTTS